MNKSFDNFISQIRHTNWRDRFVSELEHLQGDTDVPTSPPELHQDLTNDEWVQYRIDQLCKIIDSIPEKTYPLDEKQLFQKHLNEVESLAYKKPWNRLYPLQRWLKLKPFLENLLVDQKNKNQILSTVENKVTNGEYKHKKDVMYNSVSAEVMDVHFLTKNEETNNFDFI